ncbi:h+transporting two sector atpase gamma subunit [mine drainage metagenome]|uniref:H+transporting two sector atpase gamma subunit n=1 Tax=mine drainage metagenome TaxID=410659 RepID=T1BJB9_9ZZZZ
MTERLAEIEARIQGTQQLGAVVNAMRGMAAARAQQARSQLAAVESYAADIAGAIGSALELVPASDAGLPPARADRALVLFCAEQGFAGAFSERVLDAADAQLPGAELLLIGSHGLTATTERGLHPGWTGAMPAHTQGVPKLADRIVEVLYARMTTGAIEWLDVVFSRWQPAQPIQVESRRLLPPDLSIFPRHPQAAAPLVNLAPALLLQELVAAYLHAQLCDAALHAFAAENQARMETMAAAHQQIGSQLADLQAVQRQVRQEAITEEIIELAAGETASRATEGGW